MEPPVDPLMSPQLESGLPDWLQSFRQEEEELPSQPAVEGGLSDWLADEAEAGSLDWLPGAESAPDWLGEVLSNAEPAAQEDEPAESLPPVSSFPAPSLSEPSFADPLILMDESEPEWLASIRPSLSEEQPVSSDADRLSWEQEDKAEGLAASETGSEPQAPAEPIDEEAAPDWLTGFIQGQGDVDSGLEAPAAVQEAQASIPPFILDDDQEGSDSGELPDWLAGVSEAAQGSVDADDLAPADLPGWLEAMRPVEAAAPSAPLPDETDRQVESSGPLSGLRGVLPAEAEIARSKKTSAYTIKLQVSENQQAHVSLLEGLVKEEGTVRPLPSRPAISSQHVFRWLIFLILVLGIGWTVFTGSQDIPLPEISAEALDLSSAISALPEGSPVLLAVDYQPGLSPEMDAAAAAVVDHLMIQGAYLAIVSTIPTGPVQAERLLDLVNASGGHQYLDINQYANLGFIPGGPAGLRGFADAPQRVLPYALENASFVWQNGPLQNVSRLENFGLVLVVTENPDTAREWIEQVGLSLGDTPLLMVVSAQAEPIVRPYYEGSPRQVRGMISGLAGAAAYENSLARMGLARRYWDSYSLSLLLAVALILLGGAVNAGSAVLKSRKKVGTEGPV
jgi:hypothetical protein